MVKKISAHVLQCIDVAMFAGGHCKGRVISESNFNFNFFGGFFENGTKLKIPLEIIPTLKQELLELKPQRDALLHQEQL